MIWKWTLDVDGRSVELSEAPTIKLHSFGLSMVTLTHEENVQIDPDKRLFVSGPGVRIEFERIRKVFQVRMGVTSTMVYANDVRLESLPTNTFIQERNL